MTDTTSDSNPYFKDVLFILDGTEERIDERNRYVRNENGHTVHSYDPESPVIPVTPEDPSLSFGHSYTGITWTERVINPGDPEWEYTITEFDFGTGSNPVIYEPMWADMKSCQAFGITLLQPGRSLPFQYSGMVKTPYTYGVYAGYQSPYIGSKRNRELLTINATDLEYHAFPHIFSSQDMLPLVISVARWRPMKQEILLADLWVKPGDCLFIPPKEYNKVSMDMHGNRNSAFACWGHDEKHSLQTETTLGDEKVFKDPKTKPHYHAEKRPTVHSRPK